MTARMKDVAAYAGVSIATVSYVVNNKPQKTISDETSTQSFKRHPRIGLQDK